MRQVQGQRSNLNIKVLCLWNVANLKSDLFLFPVPGKLKRQNPFSFHLFLMKLCVKNDLTLSTIRNNENFGKRDFKVYRCSRLNKPPSNLDDNDTRYFVLKIFVMSHEPLVLSGIEYKIYKAPKSHNLCGWPYSSFRRHYFRRRRRIPIIKWFQIHVCSMFQYKISSRLKSIQN